MAVDLPDEAVAADLPDEAVAAGRVPDADRRPLRGLPADSAGPQLLPGPARRGAAALRGARPGRRGQPAHRVHRQGRPGQGHQAHGSSVAHLFLFF